MYDETGFAVEGKSNLALCQKIDRFSLDNWGAVFSVWITCY